MQKSTKGGTRLIACLLSMLLIVTGFAVPDSGGRILAKSSPDSGGFRVDVKTSEHGRIYIKSADRSGEEILPGSDVDLTAEPEKGWQVAAVTVTGADSGSEEDVILVSQNQYRFVMPAEEVAVEAVFERKVKTESESDDAETPDSAAADSSADVSGTSAASAEESITEESRGSGMESAEDTAESEAEESETAEAEKKEDAEVSAEASEAADSDPEEITSHDDLSEEESGEMSADRIAAGNSGTQSAKPKLRKASAKEIDVTIRTKEWIMYDDYGMGNGSGNGATPRFEVKFSLDGENYDCTGQCLQPSFMVPKSEVTGKLSAIKANSLLAKVMYYGYPKYSGDKSYFKAKNLFEGTGTKDTNTRFLIVHLAAAIVYDKDEYWDTDTSAQAVKYAKALVAYAKDMPEIPDPEILLNKSHEVMMKASVSSDGAYQRTGDLTLSGAEGNYVEFPTQSGVTFVNSSDGKEIPAKSGKIRIDCGTTFYLRAPADHYSTGAQSYTSGDLKGKEYTREFKIFQIKISGYQDVGFLDTAKPEGNQVSLAVDWENNATLYLTKKTAPGSLYEELVKDNPMYSLAGAEYGVYDTEEKAAANQSPLYVLKTGENGVSQKQEISAAWIGKTLYLKERKAGKGYQLDPAVHPVAIQTGENTVSVTEVPIYATLELKKNDADNPEKGGEPIEGLSLDGIPFVWKYFPSICGSLAETSGKNALRSWTAVTEGETEGALRLDAEHLQSGNMYTDENSLGVLPLGTVVLQETENEDADYSAKGVRWELDNAVFTGDAAVVQVRETEQTDGTKTVTMALAGGVQGSENGDNKVLHVYDRENFANLTLEKKDSEDHHFLPGAVFRLLDRDGKVLVPTEKNRTTGDIDEDGLITIGEEGIARILHIPVGTYHLEEVTPPDGYLRNEDGWDIPIIGESREECRNDIKRGEVILHKVAAEDGKVMSGIPFRIRYLRTGEEHTVMTDASGNYDSRKIPHSRNTNEETEDAGLWFGLDENGDPVPVTDEWGALPYGEYEIEELRCDKNQGRLLYFDTFRIDSDVTEGNGGITNLGTIRNEKTPEEEPKIGTTAVDSETGDHEAMAKAKVTIVDTVSYEKLIPDMEYVLRGTLMNAETGDTLKDKDGHVITASAEFTPKEASGTVEVVFTFDASEMQGITTVVFEKLLSADAQILAEHEDPKDPGQTVRFPDMKTSAVDGRDGDKIVDQNQEIEIIDQVSYENLTAGKDYLVTGVLMDAATGKPFLVQGKEVTGEAAFTPKKSNGIQEVVFRFDGSSLSGGESLVVFEKLFTAEGRIQVASHEDPKDRDQTVKVRGEEESSTEETTAEETTAEETTEEETTAKEIAKAEKHSTGGTGTGSSRTTPKTGDDARTWLYVLLMAAAGTAAALLWRKRE